MAYLNLSPAYGRDYKNQKSIKADWQADKDFIIETFNHPYCGKPVNRSQLIDSGFRGSVEIRYRQMRKLVVIPVK